MSSCSTFSDTCFDVTFCSCEKARTFNGALITLYASCRDGRSPIANGPS